MRHGRLAALASGAILVERVAWADTPGERLRGLLGRAPLAPGEGLLIAPCASIHTCFMAYAIDAVYLDRDWRIIKIVPALAPWRLSGAIGARMTLELAAYGARALGLERGQRLAWC